MPSAMKLDPPIVSPTIEPMPASTAPISREIDGTNPGSVSAAQSARTADRRDDDAAADAVDQ